MIPNTHQSIDEIIRAASPAEKVLWQQVLLICGERAAVRQLYYCGAIVGSEFLTYSANKLYLCLNVEYSYSVGTSVANGGLITYYDELNAIEFYGHKNNPIWDATAAGQKHTSINFETHNIYFGRIGASIFSHIKFIGYRLTL